ncbi:membrane protein insertase YidC [Candidatus Binatia bacterium]|nr:membrane protein insertase YidC [Candidatus Binatia bacterium]
MDRRTLTFITVSVLIMVLYQELVLKRVQPPAPVDVPPAATANLDSAAQPNATPPEAAKTPALPAAAIEGESGGVEGRDIVVDTDLFSAVLSTAGGRIKSFTLKKFRATNEPGSPPLELIVPGEEGDLPLGIELRGAQVWNDARKVYTASSERLSVQGNEEKTLELTTQIAGQPLVKRLTFRGDSYAIGLAVETPGASALPKELTSASADGQPAAVALVWAKSVHAATKQAFEGAAALVNGKLVLDSIDKIEGQQVLPGTIAWAGFEDHYFLSAAAPDRANSLILKARGSTIESKLLTSRDGTGPVQVGYTLFLGPKELKDLEAAGHDFERAMNLGWFGPISLLLLRVLNLSHRVTGNYGLDIILLTCLVKIAFWPLTQKSFKSMREMQKLQPEMQRLREKYKDDAKQMNTEIMELYKRHKVNPLGGCLPMVLQIPVFFGLYQLLANTIQLRHAPFFFWIHDLAAPERLDVMGYGVPVLTLLLGASMFLQQRMSPQTGDPTQQRVMMFMPLLFTFMFIGFPAGLTLYWLTNNVLTIAQQYFVLRSSPPAVAA